MPSKNPKSKEIIDIYVLTYQRNEELWRQREEEKKRSEFVWLSDRDVEMFSLEELRKRFRKNVKGR